jgi:YD repeat-containing protein
MTMNTEPEGRENAVLTVALALATVLSVGMILLVLIGHVRAEERTRTFYNDKGQVTGQATTRGNTTTFSNDKGQVTGRAERRPDGTTNFYDDKGRIIGTSRAAARDNDHAPGMDARRR